jgi:GT2 family glycosyltransferase
MTPRSEMWTWELRDGGNTPDVSIIICAHGQSAVTVDCIAALVESQHVNRARAEVILVDDASPDDTFEIASGIRGLRVVRLPRNVGFLIAANAGVAESKGRNILFLNNDTEPVGQWLDPLLELFDRRPAALVVGSRLVYPDGRLQEAGGIIFDDASGWNYGRGLDAFDPRFTYEREVDYVSGASLMVRGGFLRERGGFDVRFAPAYYEDTDLCFAARAAGGEVWYQPASIVVHHEGQSHGTDVGSGVKAHQVTNQVTFRRLWAAALERQWPNDPAHVPAARQRSLRKSRIVVIDNAVPAPDEDSGSVRLTAVINAMVDDGYAVTFVPINGWRREPYTRRLEKSGVEVLGVPDEWWEHLASMAESVSHVWISRPDVAEVVLDRVRATIPDATVIYDTVDLHFLRMERQAGTTDDAATRLGAVLHKQLELDLIERSDLAVVVSEYEATLLAKLVDTPVVVVPNIHAADDRPVFPDGRAGLLFVGGFQHRPNEDAVVWFVEDVLPLVLRRHPDCVLTVVGSNVTPAVKALAAESVRVTGWVADLAPFYAATRLAIAPLRFGAGVKGKVGEAMALGVPMSMTTIAAEGMHIDDGIHAMVADRSELMAQQICQLLEDDELWRALSARGRELINERFGVARARELLVQALRPVPEPAARADPLVR